LLHALTEPLPVHFPSGVGGGFLEIASVRVFTARSRCRSIPLLLQAFLDAIQAVSETILIARQSAKRVFGRVIRALTGALRFASDLTLRVRKLTRFELQIAERPASSIRRGRLELVFEITKFFQSLCGIGTRLVSLLATELIRRIAHRLRDVAHFFSALRAGSSRLRIVLT
jgi:hypothetical protein